LILTGKLPDAVRSEIVANLLEMGPTIQSTAFAIRSSATTEDLPHASFAGLHDSFLNVKGVDEILKHVIKCYASLFNSRAIKYRLHHGIAHTSVSISVGIQEMVRSDKGSSGVCFTLDPETGFRNVIVINSSWGLCENIVQGSVSPDEFIVFKPLLGEVSDSIISRQLGAKEKTMVIRNAKSGTYNTVTSRMKRSSFSLSNKEVLQLAIWAKRIEDHYHRPMDVEWAKDGLNGRLYIIQARPETVHTREKKVSVKMYQLRKKGKKIVSGTAVGYGIVTGKARVLETASQSIRLQPGEILVTKTTNPDWDPIIKKASAIITERGGRTSHAAIVARELGAVALVGAEGVTRLIQSGQTITVDDISSSVGNVYDGKAEWDEKEVSISEIPETETLVKLILADPDQAFQLSFYPNSGIGLLRLEFIISNKIRIHPMALIHMDHLRDFRVKKQIEKLIDGYSSGKEFFIDQLALNVAKIAAAFYPKPVTVRLSDFKTDEYAGLIGGSEFEMKEENPMIGFRGASRYYHKNYREGFELECAALKKVRDDMGLTNVQLMVPFCRTIKEADEVIHLFEKQGLKRGERLLKILMMCEIPSNIILAEEFAKRFDGFSIGSNDLTQLILGVDRGNPLLSELFNENDPAVRSVIEEVIRKAIRKKIEIGFCGQIPSDDPNFAEFLVDAGINSISFNPDAVIKGILNIAKAEKHFKTNKNE
jgi:pyruvate,water dikinase